MAPKVVRYYFGFRPATPEVEGRFAGANARIRTADLLRRNPDPEQGDTTTHGARANAATYSVWIGAPRQLQRLVRQRAAR